MAAKKAKPARKKIEPDKPKVPKLIYAQASPHSLGGVSLFDVQEQCSEETVANFFSDEELIYRAITRLQDAGFEVLQASGVTINIAGSPAAFERAFKVRIEAQERPVIKDLGAETTATFLENPETELPGLISTAGTEFADLLEGVAIEEPRYFMAPSMFAPLKTYWHLRMPGDVSLACNADRAHRSGITGRGVKVAMVDSGWYKHPYFVGRGYRVAPVVLGPGAAKPLSDESGHGTGESANIFAVAPDAELFPVKMNFANTIGAFNAAVGLNPHIITCSWGSDKRFGPLSAADLALAASIAAAVASGITVIFAAGNGHWGFPGQHPDVISAGGTYMKPDESLMASDYASGFLSNIYPNRRVPDLCGLVGMRPKAIYLMLPVEPKDSIDSVPWNVSGGLQGGTHPQGDETANNDGWAAFSGTSAAAPQLAGAAALVKQSCFMLTPTQIKDVLMKTARDVVGGSCNPSTGGHGATFGPDLATGTGLVDAHKATLVAKIRCLTRIGPPITIRPSAEAAQQGAAESMLTPAPQPIRPIRPPIFPPIVTVRPPIRPIIPITPIRPIRPIRPITPIINPAPFSQPEGSVPSAGEGEVEQPDRGLSSDDAKALEELIMNSGLDLD